MAKLLTLFTLLPKAHQITLSLLVILTTFILMFPSEDAQASKQTRLVSQSADKSDIETNERYAIPLAFRTPTAPSHNDRIVDDESTDFISNDALASSDNSEEVSSGETPDDEAFSQHLAMLQTSTSDIDGMINDLDQQVATQKAKIKQQAANDDYSVEYYEVAKGDTLGGL
ncbi:peptidase M23, partial [Shewanella sp. SR41-2]|nr:peptidase M23 [Shewanella sp. SR41-2]